jgi:hypothetical protein
MVWGWGIKMATYQRTILQFIDIERNYFSLEEFIPPLFDSPSPGLRSKPGEGESMATFF